MMLWRGLNPKTFAAVLHALACSSSSPDTPASVNQQATPSHPAEPPRQAMTGGQNSV